MAIWFWLQDASHQWLWSHQWVCRVATGGWSRIWVDSGGVSEKWPKYCTWKQFRNDRSHVQILWVWVFEGQPLNRFQKRPPEVWECRLLSSNFFSYFTWDKQDIAGPWAYFRSENWEWWLRKCHFGTFWDIFGIFWAYSMVKNMSAGLLQCVCLWIPCRPIPWTTCRQVS